MPTVMANGLRCPNCGKKVAEWHFGGVTGLKCPRCSKRLGQEIIVVLDGSLTNGKP